MSFFACASKAFRRVRSGASAEDGITIAELAVAMMLLVIAAAIYLGAMTSVYVGVNRQQRRSEINDEARAAIEQIDRVVRSGDILSDPLESVASPGCGGYACTPNFNVRIYTQYNATTAPVPDTRDASGHQCVQYIVEGGRLLRRAWTPVTRSVVSDWRVVATDIVNRNLTPEVPVFVRQTGGRVLDITFVVNNRLGQADAPRTVKIESSIAIRNYGSGDPCTPIPS